MSEPIKTERYRLALIAHHAQKLAELVREQRELSYNDWRYKGVPYISERRLKMALEYINNHLNKEETK